MKYQFIEQQRRYHRVEKMARVLEVSRGRLRAARVTSRDAGYYAWRTREASKRADRAAAPVPSARARALIRLEPPEER